VIAAGELHPDWTVMAIWPSPMIYAGPTEVQFHAKSRRVGGASFFTVGRDPAGMPYSSGPLEGDDLYHPDHGRYALMSSPGVGQMQFLGFEKVYYDKKDHTMRGKDPTREDDFISISGSKMRKLAALGAKPCPPQIPSDLIASKCIPPGFMVDKGWKIVSDYYIRQKTGDWVPYSKQLGGLPLAPGMRTSADAPFGKVAFTAHFGDATGAVISPWHQIPLRPAGAPSNEVSFVCEIPRGATAKLEVNKKVPHNPIMQDTKKGELRYYTYGASFFNYGMLPQTWEDPAKSGFNGTVGDNDPLDVMELGSRTCKVGEVRTVKILGDLELIDQVTRFPLARGRQTPIHGPASCLARALHSGSPPPPSSEPDCKFPPTPGLTRPSPPFQGELDHKILVIDTSDPLASQLSSADDLKRVMPGVLPKLVEWLKLYKTTDGKAENALASDTPTSAAKAMEVVADCHASWKALKARGVGDTGFWLG
jgi:3'-phosphoadenosine 5'-phosphosulfate synthase